MTRVLALIVMAYFCLCLALRLFSGQSLFNAYIVLNSLQLLLHVPLLEVEFPRLLGQVLRPLIAVAKFDFKQVFLKRLTKDFQQPEVAAKFKRLSFDHNVATYLDSLYGSSDVTQSIKAIMVLYAVCAGALALALVFKLLSQVRVLEWIYRKVLIKTFFLNFPMRLTLQTWLFILTGPILNLWLGAEGSFMQRYLSYSVSVVLLIIVVATQLFWLAFGLMPAELRERLLGWKKFY